MKMENHGNCKLGNHDMENLENYERGQSLCEEKINQIVDGFRDARKKKKIPHTGDKESLDRCG